MGAAEFNSSLGKVHLCGSPFVHLNGRYYAVATVGGHFSSSPLLRENQLEIYPPQDFSWPYMLVRRILHAKSDVHDSTFGPIWWAGGQIPSGFSNASEFWGIRGLDDADAMTQQDIAIMRETSTAASYSSQSCRGASCQSILSIKKVCPDCPAGERTHYSVPRKSQEVILYRSSGCTPPPLQSSSIHPGCVLWAATRATPQAAWSVPAPTNIPDLQSNINAGTLTTTNGEEHAFLVSNAVPRAGVVDADCNRTTALRDPLVVSFSFDGFTFDHAFAVVNTTRRKRYCGSAKSFGASYPQARMVKDAGSLDGMHIVYSVNKEDIGATFISQRIIDDIVHDNARAPTFATQQYV